MVTVARFRLIAFATPAHWLATRLGQFVAVDPRGADLRLFPRAAEQCLGNARGDGVDELCERLRLANPAFACPLSPARGRPGPDARVRASANQSLSLGRNVF
jgi:hypothetical protein